MTRRLRNCKSNYINIESTCTGSPILLLLFYFIRVSKNILQPKNDGVFYQNGWVNAYSYGIMQNGFNGTCLIMYCAASI